jgi:competence protein ComEA
MRKLVDACRHDTCSLLRALHVRNPKELLMKTLVNVRNNSRATLLAGLAAALLCALPAQAQSARGDHTQSSAQTAQAAGVVNLNTASEAELVRLPGIGPSKAQKILELRGRMKRFKRLEDLMRVKGIGRKTFRKLRAMLTLNGPTTLQAPAKAKKRKQK